MYSISVFVYYLDIIPKEFDEFLNSDVSKKWLTKFRIEYYRGTNIPEFRVELFPVLLEC